MAQYAAEAPPFGFNGLGELVYRRTYSRMKPDGKTREQWFETVERVVNGAFSMQKEWLIKNQLEWDAEAMQQTAQEMYRRIFAMKFLPPGRGLWAMGSALTEERCVCVFFGLGTGLFVCECVCVSYIFQIAPTLHFDRFPPLHPPNQPTIQPNPTTQNRRLYAALNNCGFVSTADMANEPSAPFAFLMDASMLGVGVGFDTRVRL